MLKLVTLSVGIVGNVARVKCFSCRKMLRYCNNLTDLPSYIFRSQICKMSTSGTITESIVNKLKEKLEPLHLNVVNESYMHNVPKGAETHFKVHVVSDKFNDQALIKRHRMVNDVLKYELQNGVHALSIVAETPKQWQESERIIEPSPNCRGGFGK